MSTTGLTVTISSDHGYVLLAAGLIAFQIIIVGFGIAGRARGKIFTKEFMEANFGDIHYKETKQKIPVGGYPDMGNGRFAAKLSYQEWLAFNKAQRVHYTYLEVIASILTFIILGGILYPIPAAVIGFIFVVSRIGCSWYTSPEGASHPIRSVGATGVDLCLLAGFILVIISAVKVIQG